MLEKLDMKKYAMVVFFSFATVTGLNILINSIYPNIPVIKSGIGFLLILLSISLVLIFTVASDGKLDREDIISVLIIFALMTGIYFLVRNFIPQIFSFIPENTKEVFSFVP